MFYWSVQKRLGAALVLIFLIWVLASWAVHVPGVA